MYVFILQTEMVHFVLTKECIHLLVVIIFPMVQVQSQIDILWPINLIFIGTSGAHTRYIARKKIVSLSESLLARESYIVQGLPFTLCSMTSFVLQVCTIYIEFSVSGV